MLEELNEFFGNNLSITFGFSGHVYILKKRCSPTNSIGLTTIINLGIGNKKNIRKYWLNIAG